MVRGNKKLFNDPYLLTDLLFLRSNGWSITSLALLYNVDHKAIEYHCNKYRVIPLVPIYTIERLIVQVLPKPVENQWRLENGEKINKGKSYKDYLNDYSHRKEKSWW